MKADRLGDLDHLLLGDGQLAHHAGGIQTDAQIVEQRLRHARHLAVIDQAKRVLGFAPDPDVLGHRHRVHQVQFLMDHGDAGIQRIQRRADIELAPGETHLAPVGVIDAGDDLHQRGLARAVLAHQCVDRAGADLELNIIQRHDAGEFLADVIHLKDEFALKHAARIRTLAVKHGPLLPSGPGGRPGLLPRTPQAYGRPAYL